MITRIVLRRESEVRYVGMMRRFFALLFVAALVSCAAPHFNGVVLDPPDAAPALRLADSAGQVFDLAAERGKVVLVFFGYTQCPDVCPTTLLDWKRAADSLGEQLSRARFVFVSVDPERDTPAAAQRYASRFSASTLPRGR